MQIEKNIRIDEPQFYSPIFLLKLSFVCSDIAQPCLENEPLITVKIAFQQFPSCKPGAFP